jgi:hypothetical protein
MVAAWSIWIERRGMKSVVSESRTAGVEDSGVVLMMEA